MLTSWRAQNHSFPLILLTLILKYTKSLNQLHSVNFFTSALLLCVKSRHSDEKILTSSKQIWLQLCQSLPSGDVYLTSLTPWTDKVLFKLHVHIFDAFPHSWTSFHLRQHFSFFGSCLFIFYISLFYFRCEWMADFTLHANFVFKLLVTLEWLIHAWFIYEREIENNII